MNSLAEQEAVSRATRLWNALPEGNFFHEKNWRVSPDPFLIPPSIAAELDKWGYRLTLFLKACNQLYRLSAEGRRPPWIAELLDRGKPPQLVALQRQHSLAQEIPRVIRPDMILTEEGFVIAELDSIPGGIGLTAWLNCAYSEAGMQVLGGPQGMLEGFRGILPGGDILISEEAGMYRPEMEWLVSQLNAQAQEGEKFRVLDTQVREDWQPHIYRFFENFDWENVPAAPCLATQTVSGKLSVTPPFKPALEEKLWFALFWLKPLEDFWRRELGERTLLALQKVIPYSWIVDPAPLPPHAVLPRLEIQSWGELARFSQKERELVLKVSGFSELAWGSRGVTVGQDIAQEQWSIALERALAEFEFRPRVLQKFHKGKIFEQRTLTPEGTLTILRGRVRLCPYYFIHDAQTVCGGALATIVPADKKLIHGMSEAILTPCAV